MGTPATPAVSQVSSQQARYLIVNADDLGLSDGVTEGIVKAWHDGVVTSTSAMVNIAGAPQRITAAHRAHPEMPIGLHLNVTTGNPVLPPDQVPTLVDGRGRFYSAEALMARLGQVSLDQLRAELQAQAELLRASGVDFDHIDYHEGVLALYPPFFDVVLELARAYGVPLRQPVPASVYGRFRFPGGGGAAAALRRMASFGLRHPLAAVRLMRHLNPNAFKARASRLRAEGLAAPDWFVDGYFGHPSVETFMALLAQLPVGVTEVAVHPGLVDEGLRALGGGYVRQREAELAVLLDRRVRTAIEAEGVQLVTFGQVAGA